MACSVVLLEPKLVHINILQFSTEKVILHGSIAFLIDFNVMKTKQRQFLKTYRRDSTTRWIHSINEMARQAEYKSTNSCLRKKYCLIENHMFINLYYWHQIIFVLLSYMPSISCFSYSLLRSLLANFFFFDFSLECQAKQRMKCEQHASHLTRIYNFNKRKVFTQWIFSKSRLFL